MAAVHIALQGAWYLLNDDGTGQVIPYDLTGEQLADALDQLLATERRHSS